MDLQEFVKTTLVQIVSGVDEARKAIEQIDTNARVNLQWKGQDDEAAMFATPSPVEFDVAVTVSDTVDGSVGAKLKIANLVSLGAEMKEQALSQSISRVRFTVGLSQPASVETKPARKPQPIQYGGNKDSWLGR